MRGNNENQMRRKAEAGIMVMEAVEEDDCL